MSAPVRFAWKAETVKACAQYNAMHVLLAMENVRRLHATASVNPIISNSSHIFYKNKLFACSTEWSSTCSFALVGGPAEASSAARMRPKRPAEVEPLWPEISVDDWSKYGQDQLDSVQTINMLKADGAQSWLGAILWLVFCP